MQVEVDEHAPGDRRKTRQLGWKEARLTLVYAKGSAQPVFGVTTGSHEDVGEQLVLCAERVGIGAHTRVHGVGDGATWIADRIECVFGAQGSYSIDFYHLSEYLAAAGKYRADNPGAWLKAQKARIKAGAIDDVLKALFLNLEPPESGWRPTSPWALP